MSLFRVFEWCEVLCVAVNLSICRYRVVIPRSLFRQISHIGLGGLSFLPLPPSSFVSSPPFPPSLSLLLSLSFFFFFCFWSFLAPNIHNQTVHWNVVNPGAGETNPGKRQRGSSWLTGRRGSWICLGRQAARHHGTMLMLPHC